MKVKYFVAIATASVISVGLVAVSRTFNTVQANPCASQVNPCAGANPCAGKNPCAGANPCAGENPCAGKNPCAGANPCAGENPCAGKNPCAGANPCAGTNPCAGKSSAAPSIYSDTNQLAIRGSDPVAYFKQGKPIQGSNKYEYKWMGATWRFSSAENKALFMSNPKAFAPQYGGYCAKAVSEGNLASIDPNAWKIVNGKLYLNYSPDVQKQWMQDISGNIAKADANWPKVLEVGVVH